MSDARGVLALELADRFGLMREDRDADNVNAHRLELAQAWREWMTLPDKFPTDRVLRAMGALLPLGYRIDPDEPEWPAGHGENL